jgi:hypothetical protein
MVDTASSRGFAWGLQTDFVTQKTIAAAALRRIVATDENTIDYEPQTNNDEGWSHGQNQKTEQWLEAHDSRVQHTVPALVTELGRPLILNLGNYAVDDAVGRHHIQAAQLQTAGPGRFPAGESGHLCRNHRAGLECPDAAGGGGRLHAPRRREGRADARFGLQGAGLINPASAVTWPPAATPTVAK